MPQIEIAHIREQGQDMIIAPLSPEFGNRSSVQQNAAIREIQMAAQSAGLAGNVVVVWDNGGGRMAFIAPRPWHPFFSGMSLDDIYANLNRTLRW